MYKEHKVFKKPDNKNIKIWRYLDFTKFVSLIDRKALFFARADKFSDPFEGSYSKANIQLRPTVYKGMTQVAFYEMQERIKYVSKNIIKFTCINCWNINEYESAAMWKLYLKSDEGVAIQSTFRRLTESFNSYSEMDIYIGEVQYIDYETEWMPEGNVFYPFLYKRKSFEHEHELRAIIQKLPINKDDKINLTQETFNIGLNIPVNLDTLIEKIYLSPASAAWFTDAVRSVVDKYALNKEIVQSSLTEGPVY